MRMIIDSSELTPTKYAIGMDASPAILRPATKCPLGFGVERGPVQACNSKPGAGDELLSIMFGNRVPKAYR
jgi:hypothetical protein